MIGWILFTGAKNTPKAWPAASTTIEATAEGYKLTSVSGATATTDDIDFTLDFPNAMAFLHPEDGEDEE